ncbi:HAD hydrolase [Rickettsiales bacterium Ac37b]|nr:HAD hydrolase [Rickettsiales bacterium Ac37b]
MEYSNIKSYQVLLIDLFGVIHDGKNLYPNVQKALESFNYYNKEVYFLSNAPRRANSVKQVLKKLGIDKSLYKDVITSGELAYLLCLEYNLLKGDYFYIGLKQDSDVFEGLRYNAVQKISEALCIVTTGFFDDYKLETIIPYLNEALSKQLIMFCLNPDLEVMKQNGQKELCAGTIAAIYTKMGGQVIYFGKPYDAIYDFTSRIANITNKSKILAIGDGLETDILGANKFGIDSLFIAGGMFKREVLTDNKIDQQQLQRLCKKFNVMPTFVTPLLSCDDWVNFV